jgi:hypothetical protein
VSLPDSDAELGYLVVQEGLLKQLRARVGFPRMLMSELLYTTIPVYTAWELVPETKIRRASAVRIGRFYRNAVAQLKILEEEGINLADLLPWHQVAMAHHATQEGMMRRYRDGEIEAIDLGVLGLWGYREDLP